MLQWRWDSGLTNINQVEPMNYKNNAQAIPIPTDKSKILPALHDYFLDSIFDDALGVVANLHVVFATIKMARAECI